jgi:fused signal recognition particle receptor
MFGLGKKNKADKPTKTAPPQHKSLFQRLRGGMSKTRQNLGERLGTVLLGKKTLDDGLIDTLETILITADVGVSATQAFLERLRKSTARKHANNETVLLDELKTIMLETLLPAQKPIPLTSAHEKPFVIMMVGINGAGKTTTAGKLAKQFQSLDKTVMLAAADTFRAAAVEQLQIWGERNQVPVIAQHAGADSAAVCFDALQSAKAKDRDILIADTAGRLHTQSHLMEELKKVKRVMQKVDAKAPHEILLVLDASIGQNALQQAKLFNEAVGITGLCMTKLDGSAKGGIIFAIVQELGLPIRYIGVGEQLDDLRPFNAKEFVDALFEQPDEEAQ